MKTLDQVAAWAIAAIGVLHAGTTWVTHKQFSMSAVWFFDAAVVFWLTSALNLLRVRYAAVAPGVRIFSSRNYVDGGIADQDGTESRRRSTLPSRPAGHYPFIPAGSRAPAAGRASAAQ